MGSEEIASQSNPIFLIGPPILWVPAQLPVSGVHRFVKLFRASVGMFFKLRFFDDSSSGRIVSVTRGYYQSFSGYLSELRIM